METPLEDIDRELAELERKRIELLEKRQASLAFVVEVSSMDGDRILLKSAFNQKYVDMMKEIPTRLWQSYTKVWEIRSQDWGLFQTIFKTTFENGKIAEKEPGVFDKITAFLNSADFTISKSEKHIVIKTRSGVDNYEFRKYSGFETPKPGVVNIPLAEAYRVPEVIEKYYATAKVDWAEGVKEFCASAYESHYSIQKYHKLEDTDEVSATLGKYTLHPFQKVGVAFARAANRGLIADPMGLGKTIQALGFVAETSKKLGRPARAIIVCPASLKRNWARMIVNATGQDAHFCEGREPDKIHLRNIFDAERQFVIINYDIIGSNFTDRNLVDKDNVAGQIVEQVRYPWVEYLNMAKFDCIILDEAHKAKNLEANRTRATLKLEAPYILALTGTPVLNRPGELWPVLHLLYPRMFPAYETFLRDFTWDKKRPRNVEQLREMLSSIMIRRERSQVQKDLPPVNRIEEYVELREENRREYNDWMARVLGLINDEEGNSDKKKVVELLELLMRLKQVCARNNVQEVVEKAIELNEEETGQWKKVIIFSQFRDIVDSLAEKLRECGEFTEDKCLTITGDDSMDERTRKCDLFQNNDQYQFLVCTTQVASEGLTLTQAGFVLFNDLMWTPAAHQQAEGRAYGRINDAHSITAYYFLCGKVMEWIWELLAFKMKVIDETVDGKTVTYNDDGIVMELIERLKLEG